MDGALDNNFNVDNQPAQMALWPATALLFHRWDVKESQAEAWQALTDDQALDPETAYTLPPILAWTRKTGIQFTGKSHASADLTALLNSLAKSKQVSTATNPRQITYDYGQGQMTVDTPRTQGFAGFTTGAPLTLSGITVDLKNEFGVVLVQSLENKPLAESSRLLVTAVGNAINTGMETVPAGNRLKNPGKEPALVEPMVGKVRILQPHAAVRRRVRSFLPMSSEPAVAAAIISGTRPQAKGFTPACCCGRLLPPFACRFCRWPRGSPRPRRFTPSPANGGRSAPGPTTF